MQKPFWMSSSRCLIHDNACNRAQAFKLRASQLSGGGLPALAAFVQALLREKLTYTPAVRLIMHFEVRLQITCMHVKERLIGAVSHAPMDSMFTRRWQRVGRTAACRA